jgi:hypothetical protein
MEQYNLFRYKLIREPESVFFNVLKCTVLLFYNILKHPDNIDFTYKHTMNTEMYIFVVGYVTW